jgi:ATP-binding cassette, subfamily B, bacterial
MGLGGIVLSFIISWMYTLIAFAYMPIVFFGFAIFGSKVKQSSVDKMTAVKDLGSYTEETLSALKLVVSFNREDFTVKEFDKIVEKTADVARSSARQLAGMMGFMMCTMFGFFCYSYYIGSILVQKNMTEPGTGKKFDVNLIVTAS